MNSERVADDADVVAGRQGRLHFFEPLLHRLDDLDRIGARLPPHLQQHRAGAVHVGDRLGLGLAVLDPRDVARCGPGARPSRGRRCR